MLGDQAAWSEQVMGEVAKLEANAADQAKVAIDQMTHLAKESLSYGLKLSSEWRRLALESMKQSTALFSTRS